MMRPKMYHLRLKISKREKEVVFRIVPNPFVRCREATTTDCRWAPEPILVDGTAWFVDGSADLKKDKEVGKFKKKIFFGKEFFVKNRLFSF